MTPAELSALVEAHNEREKAEWMKLAWFTSILLSPHLKRGRSIAPEKLLPELFREKKDRKTKEEAKQELAEIKKKLGIE